MLTRTEYNALLHKALHQYTRYMNAYPNGAHIVFVASPSVLEASSRYFGNLSFSSAWTLFGKEVYLIDGYGDETILAPALEWRNDADRISLGKCPLTGDLLIDDYRLYVYCVEQTYRPTGHTVRGGAHIDAGNISGGTLADHTCVITDGQRRSMQTMSVSVPPMGYTPNRKKACAEQALDPGDTKAIDDYLNSFAQQTMQSGA